jgi:hypothetical protein
MDGAAVAARPAKAATTAAPKRAKPVDQGTLF